MRHLTGELVKTAKFRHPASIIVSGSSGVGKTSFALELVKHQHFSKPIRHLYYFGCTGGRVEQLNWHKILPDVAVTYCDGLPSSNFFATVKKHSLVVIDDQYEGAVLATPSEHIFIKFTN